MSQPETIPFPAHRAGASPVVERTLPAREHEIVHYSYGRLRVHLPSWTGHEASGIETKLRTLPGVTRATANGLTGNILILFNPKQTGPEVLITELMALPFPEKCVMVPALKVVTAEPTPSAVEQEPHETQYVTGARRVLYHMLGWASVVMAIIGAILPGIPTAPFVILAGYFFIRSSREAHEWLRNSRWFGQILRDWEEHHGISRKTRNFAVGLILVSAGICSMLGLSLPLLLSIYAMQLAGLVIVLRLRVVDHPQPALEPTVL
jgi:uncharacterized membrane protein YbaN (DUF454 family)